MKPNELYARITATIIELMETHGSDWTRPWVSHRGGMHRNIVTDAPYHGINVLLIGRAAYQRGYDSPLWGTYRQWNAKGGQVRKGEKGTKVTFWKFFQKQEDDDSTRKGGAMLRIYTVFNVEQIDGLDLPPIEKNAVEPIEAAQEIIDGYKGKLAGGMKHGASVACYKPSHDQICMPEPGDFESMESYYSTAFHEMAHSTGHRTRLNREGVTNPIRFGSHDYSREELVAELGAAFLCGVTGIDCQEEQSAAYLASWIKALKNDPRALIVAGGHATKAAQYITGEQDNV